MNNGRTEQLVADVMQHAKPREISEAIQLLARTERLGGELVMTSIEEAVDQKARLATGRDVQMLVEEVRAMRAELKRIADALEGARDAAPASPQGRAS